MRLRSPAAEMKLGANNMVQTALFTGGVDFESEAQGASGHSGAMLLHFVPVSESRSATERRPSQKQSQLPHSSKGSLNGPPVKRGLNGAPGNPKTGGSTSLLKNIYASQGVTLRQEPKAESKDPQRLALSSSAMTFNVADGQTADNGTDRGGGRACDERRGSEERRRSDGDRRAALYGGVWR